MYPILKRKKRFLKNIFFKNNFFFFGLANEIQGIFRLSGGAATVQQLRKDFDKGEDVSLNTIEDPHIVAGLLKLFLRELPEPVFPFDHYHELIEAYSIRLFLFFF